MSDVNIQPYVPTPQDDPPVPNAYNFGSFYYDSNGNRVYYTGKDAGSNTLLDLQAAFGPSQADLNNKAQEAFELMSGDPSNLSYVAAYQAANSALMNLFGAQTNVLKSVYEKAESIYRNMA